MHLNMMAGRIVGVGLETHFSSVAGWLGSHRHYEDIGVAGRG